jgi:hypothetical protein
MDEFIRLLDIEIYDTEKSKWAQGRYLVHGHDDVLWTDDLDSALEFLRESAQPKHDRL